LKLSRGTERAAIAVISGIIERRGLHPLPLPLPRRVIAAGGGANATGDGDGPLRDAFANRDINTKRSFIFFYASLPPPFPRPLPPFSHSLDLPSLPKPRDAGREF